MIFCQWSIFVAEGREKNIPDSKIILNHMDLAKLSSDSFPKPKLEDNIGEPSKM